MVGYDDCACFARTSKIPSPVLTNLQSHDVVCSGYVEFWKTEACEKGATLNGKNLLGRPIRIDWTD